MTLTSLAAWLPSLIALIGGIAGLAALLRVGPERRKITSEADKSGADAVKALSAAAVALLDPTREQVAFLQADLLAAHDELKALRPELQALRRQVDDLDGQLRSANRELTALRSRQAPPNAVVMEEPEWPWPQH